eukprot:411607-Prymnesium_polylepis.1
MARPKRVLKSRKLSGDLALFHAWGRPRDGSTEPRERERRMKAGETRAAQIVGWRVARRLSPL